MLSNVSLSPVGELFTVDSMPLRVNGLTSLDTLKVKLSVWSSQLKPKLRWRGKGSAPNSRSLKSLARSSRGKASMTFVLFEAILCSLKLDSASRALVRCRRSIASTSFDTEASPSST